MTSSPNITTIVSSIVTSTLGDYHSINPDPRFIGYRVDDVYPISDPYTLNCNSGSTWFSSGTAGACCPASVGCTWPIKCSFTSTLLLSGTTTTCSYGSACVTDRVVDRFSITYTTMSCDSATYSDRIFSRQVLAFATSTIVSTIEPSTSSSSVSPTVVVITTTSSTLSSSSTSDSTNGPAPSTSADGSKAWIAGAVVGPVVGATLLAGLIFFLWRRRQSHKARSSIGPANEKTANPIMSPTMK